MSYSQFHALQKDVEDLRSTADVFSSVTKKADVISARFSSGGKFTEEQFKAGEDAKPSASDEVDAAVAAEAEAQGARIPGTAGRFGGGGLPPNLRRGPMQWRHAAAANPPCVAAGYDPNDTRSLYDRLKEVRDAKQEEWEEAHKFKNQMNHWKLDEDDAAFEEVFWSESGSP